MLVLALARRRRARAFLSGTAVRWIGIIIRVSRAMAWLLVRVAVFVVVVLTFVRVFCALAVMTFAGLTVLLMVGQLADLMTFAGPEEDQGSGRRDGDRVAEKWAHRPDSRHRL